MLPEGWKQVSLGELGRTFGGLTGKSAADFGSGKKFIPYVNIFKNERIDVKSLEFVQIAPGEHQNTTRYGDIFFTGSSETANEVGMTSVLLNEVDNVYLNSFCFGYRLHDFNQLIPEYAVYALRATEIRTGLKKLAQGSTRFNISKAGVLQLQINLPSNEEQRRIAQILSTWDQAISKAEQLLKNSEQHKHALIRDLMGGRKRLNGFIGKWCNAQLQEVCTLHKGSTLSKADLSHDGKNACILYGELFTIYAEVIAEVRSRTSSNQGFLAKKGDVLIPTATTTVAKDLAKASVLMVENVLVGGDAIIARPRVGIILGEFLAYLITYVQQGEIAARAQGATIVHISAGALADIKLCFPPSDEQTAICAVLRKANTEICLLTRYMERLKTEKTALMSQLLTGKRRVKLPQAETEVQA